MMQENRDKETERMEQTAQAVIAREMEMLTPEQKMVLVEEAKMEMNVRMVLSNTNYTRDEAVALLREHGSAEEVVRQYLGIAKKDTKKIKKSVNQEIFRQIRTTFDISCEEYRKKNPLKLEEVVQHFQEQEQGTVGEK